MQALHSRAVHGFITVTFHRLSHVSPNLLDVHEVRDVLPVILWFLLGGNVGIRPPRANPLRESEPGL